MGSLAIETEHVLLGLVREAKGLTSRVFERASVSLPSIRSEISKPPLSSREDLDVD